MIPVTWWVSDQIEGMAMPMTRGERDQYLLVYAGLEPIQAMIISQVIQVVMSTSGYAEMFTRRKTEEVEVKDDDKDE